MEKTLAVINKMQADGIIKSYAIGGATALLFYTEPALTFDLDIFVYLNNQNKLIVSLEPIYKYLRDLGYKSKQEHVMVEGIPVQFIPAYNPLVEEALAKASVKNYKRVKTKVLTLEYLACIMIETGRAKDWTRVLDIIESGSINKKFLLQILDKFQLTKKLEAKIGKIKIPN